MLIRFSIASFASFALCGVLLAADPADKSDDAQSADSATSALAEEVAEINKGVSQEMAKFMAAQRKYMTYQTESKKKLMELIDANPDDPAVLDAVMLLVEKFRTPLDNKMMEKISKSLLSNPKAGEICLKLARPNPQMASQESILKKVAEGHEDEKARGLATFALGSYNRALAANESNQAKQAEQLAAAEKHLMKVKNEYSSISAVPYLRSTIGERTDSELARIRNIPNLKVGGIEPEIEGVDMDGKPLKLSDSRGKVTVLIFWGSWCGPCMALVPHEKELYERMQGKPFQMVSVNCGDPEDRAQSTRRDKEMAWPCWWDGGTTDGPIQASYNVPHYPRIFVIDAKGVIRNIDVRHKALDEAVDKLIEEMNAGKVSQR